MANKIKINNAAAKHLQKGQYDKAIRILQKLIEEDPNDLRTRLKIGDIYYKKGDRDAATETYLEVSEYYASRGFFLKAVAVYKQILKYDPQRLEVSSKLAALYERLGLTQEAVTQYKSLANIQEQLGRPDDALDTLSKMAELDPSDVAASVRLAEIYSRRGHAAGAIGNFSRAAAVLKDQGRVNDYVKVAERLVYHDPGRLDVIKELARLYMESGDAKRAIAKLQLAVESDATDPEALSLLGHAFLKVGEQDKALFVYKELAGLYQSGGAQDDAQLVWERILELAPSDTDAQEALGRGQAAPAAPARQALPREDSALSKQLKETDVYVRYGLREKAIAHVEDVIRSYPEAIAAHEKLRDIHLEAGDRARAGEAVAGMIRLFARAGREDLEAKAREELQTLIPGHPMVHGDASMLETGEEADSVEIDFTLTGMDPSEVGLIPSEAPLPEVETIAPDFGGGTDHMPIAESGLIELVTQPKASDLQIDDPATATGHGLLGAAGLAGEGTRDPALHERTARDAVSDFIKGLSTPPEAKTVALRASEFQKMAGEDENELGEEVASAEFYLSQGMKQEALDAVKDVLRRAPEHVEALQLLARIQDLGSEEPTPAPVAEGWDKATGLISDGPELHETPLNEDSSADDGDLGAHFDLGLAYRDMGMFEEALKELALAQQAPERATDCLSAIGECYAGQGQQDKALQAWSEALQQDPSDAQREEIHYHLGVTHQGLGDAEKAAKYLSLTGPDFRDAKRRLAELETGATSAGSGG